ncbi:cytochrome c oxidase subunit II [Virgibacillus halodenitrificans]|uniref:Cytochrome aa3 subunit 2 n=1 Tax=Virgibacillus halodenitrificans TaxID=1482 RepID=A0ABR7VMM0_VIRHA|nr:cytochrome c oxidase subunit II [Virgibacillus halodenitrificans]MBD1221752.1 cytochrome c oxidase subunit II [Virgibacillus halodenitrificans]MEC2158603.1 cytochrome c oxidase subunit II [Virgibacillus halodenitrificans]MYL47624.1 cytochrome C oxidase subunit II [Virgibacillus halodenitrificans]WHX24718.1 cytochrome c oxidase subunit II [Virgibacillus halodenitrificans]
MKMHRAEEIWLVISVGVLILSMVVTGYQAFAMDMAPPSHKETIDPQKVDETAPFDNPGVFQTEEGKYEVVMTLQIFSFTPNKIEVPAGSEVTFTMTSKDVVHGFQIAGTNVNAMVMPGHIQKITQTFEEPGEYLILCNEYCGAGHQMMSTTITVK